MAKCKICRDKYEAKYFLQKTCVEPRCLAEWAKLEREKKADKVHAVKKKEYLANKLSTRKRAAKEVCHLYIRTRDKDKPCPCCGEPLGDDYHAGHFWASGNFPFLRFNEDNIHGQRSSCNTFKGGDSGFYRENLIKRIGIDRVKYLDDNRSNKVKLTADDYRAIEAEYKLKLKELQNEY